MKHNAYILAATLFATSSFTLNIHASGFQLPFNSAANIGNANAGNGVLQNNASVIASNPAALTSLTRTQLQIGVVGIAPDIHYTGTLNVYMPGSDTPIAGGQHVNQVQGGMPGPVPSLYIATPIGQRFAAGIGIDIPYGLGINYHQKIPVDLAVDTSTVLDVNFMPALAYRVSSWFSVGIGADAQYFSLKTNTQYPTLAKALGYLNYRSSLDDIQLSYHAGVMISPSKKTHIGLSYHSPEHFKLTGTDAIDLKDAPPLTGHDIESDWSLPWNASVDISQTLSRHWSLLASAKYTGWHTFQEVVYRHQLVPMQNKTATFAAPQHFNNAWDYSLGANYRANSRWLYRLGVSYEQSPTSPAYQQLWMVINDSYVVACGIDYTYSKHWSANVDYAHAWMKRVNFDNAIPASGQVPIQSIGYANVDVNMVAMQLTWRGL